MNKKLERAIKTLCIECGFPTLDVYAPGSDTNPNATVLAMLVAKDEEALRAACLSYLTDMDDRPKD